MNIIDMIGGIGTAFTGLLTIVTVFLAWLVSHEKAKRKEAEDKAEAHKAMREHERDASVQTDQSLADRLTRRDD